MSVEGRDLFEGYTIKFHANNKLTLAVLPYLIVGGGIIIGVKVFPQIFRMGGGGSVKIK